MLVAFLLFALMEVVMKAMDTLCAVASSAVFESRVASARDLQRAVSLTTLGRQGFVALFGRDCSDCHA